MFVTKVWVDAQTNVFSDQFLKNYWNTIQYSVYFRTQGQRIFLTLLFHVIDILQNIWKESVLSKIGLPFH